MDGVASVGQRDGDGSRHGGLADPAFAHTHDQSVVLAGQFLHQSVQPGQRRTGHLKNGQPKIGHVSGQARRGRSGITSG